MALNLPLPKTVADVGPAGGFISALNALNENQIKGAQAQYAPQQAYANALLTTQQANWLPYQYKMQALTNPLLWIAAQKNPDLAKQLSDSFSNPLAGTGIGNSTQNIAPPNSIGGLGGMIISSINKLIGNKSADQQPQNNLFTPPNSGSTNVNLPNTVPGTNENPVFNVKQGEAASEAQGKADVDLWKALNDQTSNAAVQSQDTLNDLSRFKEAYGKLSTAEKGFPLGHGPAITSNAQIADQAASSMRAALLRMLQQGHITNKDFDIGTSLKPSRVLNPEAENQISNFMEGAAKRAQERIEFNNQAANLHLTAPQANLLWTKYIHEKPFFDQKSGELNEDNLDSWRPYLSKQNVNKLINPEEGQVEESKPVKEKTGRVRSYNLTTGKFE